MKVRKFLALLLSLSLLLALAGCGAKSEAAYDAAAPQEAAGTYMMAETMAANSLTEDTAASAQVPENRKWIVTVDMSAETEDMDTLINGLQEHIDSLGGYVQNQRISNGSYRSNYRYRSAYLTVRIPAESVDSFTEKVSGMANVTHSSKDLEDITLSYVATQSRITALEVEQARLLELLAQAQDMKDLLTVEARLTEVRTELENVASQLRLYDNLVDYATVHLNITEVTEYTEPVEEPTTLWQELWQGLKDSAEGLVETLEDLLVFFAENFFALLIFLVLPLVALVILLRALRKKRRKAAQKKEEQA